MRKALCHVLLTARRRKNKKRGKCVSILALSVVNILSQTDKGKQRVKKGLSLFHTTPMI